MPPIEEIRLTVINADLPPERQALIKQEINEQFQKLNEKDKAKFLQCIYITNQDQRPLPSVVVANPRFDAVMTGFNVARKDFDKKTKSKEEQAVVAQTGELKLDPTIRFEAYQELFKMQQRGSFRLRNLFFVGDLNQRIREFLHFGFLVKVWLYDDAGRNRASKETDIMELAQLPKLYAQPEAGQINLSDVSRIQIGEVLFDGVVNITEQDGRFLLQDFTLDDCIKKMLAQQAALHSEIQKIKEEEKLRFVRKKRVMLVLEPGLKRVVAQRLKHDQMEQIFEFDSLEAASKFLQEGQSKGVADIVETRGVEEVAKLLDNDERDLLLVGMLGKRILPQLLPREAMASGSLIGELEDKKKDEYFELLTGTVVERLLNIIKNDSPAAFLARIRPEIRESLILEFFTTPNQALAAWNSLSDLDRDRFLRDNSPEILASLQLTQHKLFQKKFPEVVFDFDLHYDSAQFPQFSDADIRMKLQLFSEALSHQRMDQAIMDRIFDTGEFQGMISRYIGLKPREFFNFFDPEVRKSMWVAAGASRTAEILAKLTPRDKADILMGAKDQVLKALVKDVDWLADQAKKGEHLQLAGKLLLHLKQFNKAESKTGLMKRIATDPKLRDHRLEGLTTFFGSKAGKPIFEKLATQFEELQTGFDGLICLAKDAAELRKFEDLQMAELTKVDDLVDMSLMQMLEKGSVDVTKYERLQSQIEEKIQQAIQKLKDTGKHDPMGTYLSETMIIMMKMTSQAMQNKLDKAMLDKLDERQAQKNKIMDLVEVNIKELAASIQEHQDRLPQLIKRSRELNLGYQEVTKRTNELLATLQEKLRQFADYQEKLKNAELAKRRVAIVQKRLSEQFYELIRGPILAKVSSLAPMARILSSFKKAFLSEPTHQARTIFQFSDEEVEQIAKRNIVFCTDDPMLKAFILRILEIDHLANTLFAIAGVQELPPEPEILFVGADHEDLDFSDYISRKFTIVFADQNFFQALRENEAKKDGIRKALNKYGMAARSLKLYLEGEGETLRRMAQAKKSREEEAQRNSQRKVELAERLTKDQATLEFLQAERTSLQEKFQQVDQKFEIAKAAVSEALASKQGSTVLEIQKRAKELAGNLSQTLLEINKEMAALMLVKNIKDVSQTISDATQQNLSRKLDELSKCPHVKSSISEVILTGDGGMNAADILKSLHPVVLEHFGKGVTVREVQMTKLEIEIKETKARPKFIIHAAEDAQARLSNLKDRIKGLKQASPETYFVVITPYNIQEPHPDLVDNLHSLQSMALVVNGQLEDFTNPSAVRRLLQKAVP